MENTLEAWITAEIQRRGWSIRELARRGGISHTAINNALAGSARLETYEAIARGLSVSLMEVLQHTGKVPVPPQPVDGEQDALRAFRQIPDSYRELATRILEVIAATDSASVDKDAIKTLHPGESITIRQWSDNPLVRMIEQLGEPWTPEQLDFLMSVVDAYEVRQQQREVVGGGERR